MNHVELKVRAYKGKFLIPINLPDDLPTDDEIKKLSQEWTELVAIFEENYQILDEHKKISI